MVANLKANFSYGQSAIGLARASLLNDWGCFCALRKDRNAVRYEYMSGTVGLNLPPNLIFDVPWGLFATVGLRFDFQVNKSLNLSDAERHKHDDNLRKGETGTGFPVDNNSECMVNISKYQHGSWENGLDIAFKAALWLNSNQEEALINIWKTRNLP